MTKLRIGLLACAALLTCGCETFSGGNRTTVYVCEGRQMIVSFDDAARTASVSLPGEPLYVLPERAVGSGFFYADGQRGLRGQAYEARWEVGRAAPVLCYVRP